MILILLFNIFDLDLLSNSKIFDEATVGSMCNEDLGIAELRGLKMLHSLLRVHNECKIILYLFPHFEGIFVDDKGVNCTHLEIVLGNKYCTEYFFKEHFAHKL